jgi:dienelactone hydrolase
MKINPFLIFFSIMACSFSLWSQPFQTGHTTITFTDSSRSNRSIATEIYYPADSAGDNVPFTSQTSSKFPVIAFGHGFVMTWDAYQNIWTTLAPEGFIIAFPKTEGSFSPVHLDMGKDLAYLVNALKNLGNTTSSLFYGRVDSTSCVMGHSMGGGASILSVQFNSSITAVANLAAAETNPSAIAAAASITIPSLIIAGQNDCVAPPTAHQVPIYNALASSCKSYLEIKGASHCQMADANTLCSLGEATCTPPPTITRNDQHATINRFLVPWLKYQLKNDCSAGQQFDSLLISDSSITSQANCHLCANVSVPENADPVFHVFSNPFTNKINLTSSEPLNAATDFILVSADGKIIPLSMNKLNHEPGIISLYFNHEISPGIYFLKIVNGKKVNVIKLLHL